MKTIRLTVVAAIAVTAVAGGAGASAVSASVLCSTNTNPCTGTTYGAKTAFAAQNVSGKAATWTTPVGNIKCNGSQLKGELTNAEGAGVISSSIQTSCIGPFGSACTLVTENLPWTFQANASGGGNGSFAISGNGGTMPRINWSCGGFIKCKFSFPTLSFSGGNPAKLTAVEQPMVLEGALCPAEATFDAEYEVTAPKPAFVV